MFFKIKQLFLKIFAIADDIREFHLHANFKKIKGIMKRMQILVIVFNVDVLCSESKKKDKEEVMSTKIIVEPAGKEKQLNKDFDKTPVCCQSNMPSRF